MSVYNNNVQSLVLPPNSIIASCSFNCGTIRIGAGSRIYECNNNSGTIYFENDCEVYSLINNYGSISFGENCKMPVVSSNFGRITAEAGSIVQQPATFENSISAGSGDDLAVGISSMDINHHVMSPGPTMNMYLAAAAGTGVQSQGNTNPVQTGSIIQPPTSNQGTMMDGVEGNITSYGGGGDELAQGISSLDITHHVITHNTPLVTSGGSMEAAVGAGGNPIQNSNLPLINSGTGSWTVAGIQSSNVTFVRDNNGVEEGFTINDQGELTHHEFPRRN